MTVSVNAAPTWWAPQWTAPLVLNYAEDLDTGSVPAASAYTVTVAGTAVTVAWRSTRGR